MKSARMLAIPAVILALAACGSIEWFPRTSDTTAPNVTASISGKAIFNNVTTHVSLPGNVIFASSKPATIYYTTDTSAPSTSSPSVIIDSSTGVTGPTITITNTILKFFGIDTTPKKNQSATISSTIVSP